jgi:RNA repair, ligase-Pnkp-associating, region of Hen1
MPFSWANLSRGQQLLILLIVCWLCLSPGSLLSAKDKLPAVRWQEGDPQCTLQRTNDGLYHYSLSYETEKITLSIDPQELQKTRRTLEHVFRVLLTFRNSGTTPLDVGPHNISLELVDHFHVRMSSLDPDDFSYRIQDDSDELIHQSERELQKHPERKEVIEAKLKEHEKLVTQWLEYLSTQALSGVTLDSGRPEITGMVFFNTKTKWKGTWKKEENFILRIPGDKVQFEFPFSLPPKGEEQPELRERPTE